MRVVHIKNAAQREACLARLCAEAYGQEAGIAPLVTFAGVTGVLFEQEAARLLALVDDQSRPVALALLALDESGGGMTVMQLADIAPSDAVKAPAMRLVSELALRAPLRVDAVDTAQEQRFREVGIDRWFSGKDGVRIGLSKRHPATGLADLPRTLTVDEQGVVQSFKRDRAQFDDYKQRFVKGLENFPATLSASH
ncbi:hypothetical protein [Halomonas organivorans]|uniref:Uncharacterized protein n=1 Tax=Halomonas organivorans TaxID=257772 RepID=A0A7W5C0Q5_9GAMM|nr:hypothetical protein [Halomonas organivorans]MBB3142456.1 hypothetical protein [Halomonas organivorans]